jgi:RHS repeat-associated protein
MYDPYHPNRRSGPVLDPLDLRRRGRQPQPTDPHGVGGAADSVTKYTYPTAGGAKPHSLTTATTTGPGAGTDSYGYDAVGNTCTRNVGGTTQSLTWDVEGHLATQVVSSQTTSYLYDADGNRLLRRAPGGTVSAYLAGYELKENAAGTLACTRYYSIASRTSTGLTWLANDHHGTAQISIDPNTLATMTRRSMPFGETRTAAPTWANDKGFVGGTQDPTGLVHLGAREYDPGVGRFISVDPALDLSDPQQWNGYAYSNNSPTTFSDPSGMMLEVPGDGGGGCTGPGCGEDRSNEDQVATHN